MVYGDPYRDPEEDIPAAGAPTPTAPAAGGTSDAAAAAGGAMLTAGPGKNKGGGGGQDRPTFNFPGLPGFVGPQFEAPTFESAMAEPGYKFRLQAGQDALERSAAARGLLRSGGTLRDITEYGQKFGAQEYGNVFNRALSAFDRKYQGAKDAYAPQLARWQALANAETQAGLAAFNAAHRGGGGGGGTPQIPYDLLLGPPPTMPDYAQMASGAGGGAVPMSPQYDDYIPY